MEVRRLVLVTFLGLVAFSAFEATFSLLAEARFNLSESSTYALFFLIDSDWSSYRAGRSTRS